MSTNINNRSRQPKGTSKGGRFAPETHATAPDDLDVGGSGSGAPLASRNITITAIQNAKNGTKTGNATGQTAQHTSNTTQTAKK